MALEATVRETMSDTGWSRCDTPAVSALEDCILELRTEISLAILNVAASATGKLHRRYHRSIGGGRGAPFAGFTFTVGEGTIAIDIPHFKGSGADRTLIDDVTVYTMGDIRDDDVASIVDAFTSEIKTAVETVRRTR